MAALNPLHVRTSESGVSLGFFVPKSKDIVIFVLWNVGKLFNLLYACPSHLKLYLNVIIYKKTTERKKSR